MHIPNMISDLAVMLLTAGVITIIFRRIKQPLILGYILAGFLISPYFPMFFNVEDTSSITLWSEIGVIILMFHIGLEFNIHKLAKMGETAIISAIVKMLGVMAVGYGLGIIMGLSNINSIFLGGMLSISSTAVIQKSFEELGIKKEKFSQLVMGTLVIEDIVGIFMMVILSTISVSQNAMGPELLLRLGLMLCYLIAWLLLGIFILPTFLNKVMRYMNDEMVLVLSLGLCFGMVLIANKLGFSSELGAFLSGSLLAGTVHVERIEKVTKGTKDMFAAIFFLSVGMMVDPNAIYKYGWLIIVITIVAVIAKLIFATLGMILSGQTLETAIKSGFSLAPIGEFSFIIASLGISLGVMKDYLYPIIVSAAVITTFITPALIKKSGKAVVFLENKLPEKIRIKLELYTSKNQVDDDEDNDWNLFIKAFFRKICTYGVIMLVAVMAGTRGLAPFLSHIMPSLYANIASCVLIYAIIALFIKPLLNFHSTLFTALWLKSKSNRPPLIFLTAVKIAIIVFIAIIPLRALFEVDTSLLAVIIILVLLIAGRSNFMATSYLKLETRFLSNLNERIIKKEEQMGKNENWIDEELHIITLVVPENANYLKRNLRDLAWGRLYNVYVMKIRRNHKHRILPNNKTIIQPDDKLYIVGRRKSLLNFYHLIDTTPTKPPRTLKEFMESGYSDDETSLACCAIKLEGNEAFAGKTLKSSKLKEKYHCMVVGLQQSGYSSIMPNANVHITKDDILWVMGSNNNVGRLAAISSEIEIEEN